MGDKLVEESFEITSRDKKILKQYGIEYKKLVDCSIRTYHFSERVLTEGIKCEKLFIVTDGKAKVGAMTPNGKNLILCFYMSSGIMGDMEMMVNSSVGATTVTALENLRCICIPTLSNREYLLDNNEFLRKVSLELATKLENDCDMTVVHTLYSAETRLCRYIIEASNDGWFRDIMTDVAYSIGTSYRHLYRMMKKLCDDNLLEKTETGYRIIDIEELTYRSRQI